MSRAGTGRHTVRMGNPQHSDSIVIARSPEDVYDMVSDVTRMGEWSPVCKACWWDEGGSPRVGAWFTGRNELPDRTWETRPEGSWRCSNTVVSAAGTLTTSIFGGITSSGKSSPWLVRSPTERPSRWAVTAA